MSTYMKQRRENRRNQLIELKGGCCNTCSSTQDLQFDHTKASDKSFTLSGAGLDKAWATILDEVKKCVLLCHPCHTLKSLASKDFQGGHNKNTDPFLHGTARMYSEQQCRCDQCKKSKKLYRDKQLSYTGIC